MIYALGNVHISTVRFARTRLSTLQLLLIFLVFFLLLFFNFSILDPDPGGKMKADACPMGFRVERYSIFQKLCYRSGIFV